MRGIMMIAAVGLAAAMLLPVTGSTQPWPERREEWRDRCLQIRDELEHARHEEQRAMSEGERHEARDDEDRVEHMRHEFDEHRCEEILRG